MAKRAGKKKENFPNFPSLTLSSFFCAIDITNTHLHFVKVTVILIYIRFTKLNERISHHARTKTQRLELGLQRRS